MHINSKAQADLSLPTQIATVARGRENRLRSPHRNLSAFQGNFVNAEVGQRSLLINDDCFAWLKQAPECSVHGVVTDPPYGVKEYEADQLAKRESGNGGIWRLPPSFDGSKRAPMPRFTALNRKERNILLDYFTEWSRSLDRVLVPGAHVFVACNTFLSQLVYSALVDGGLEHRGEIIRLVSTFRGGDRPKNHDKEFPDLCTLPRGNFEPWGLFRKAIPAGMTVGECLRQFRAGALRRTAREQPFGDVIASERTSVREKEISGHPSLKPQSYMRQLVRAAMPFDDGILLDPFMGGGSTIAAAEALGLTSVGIERHSSYYQACLAAIPCLASLQSKSNVATPSPASSSKPASEVEASV